MSLLLLYAGVAIAFNPASSGLSREPDRQEQSVGWTQYDPTEQSWAVGPPLNATLLSVILEEGLFPYPSQARWDYPPDQQSWAVGPRLNADSLDQWTDEGHYPDQSVVRYQPEDQAWVQPPINATALTEWDYSQPDVAQGITFDPTDQTWAIPPPLNATLLTEWTTEGHLPDRARLDFDPTDQAYPIQPPAAAPFDPSTGFSWNGDDRQDLSTWPLWYDPTEQAWSIGTPLNAVALSAWVESQPDVTQPLTFDPTDQSWTIQPPVAAPFDPSAGFPWTVEQDLPSQARADYQPEDQAWNGEPAQNAVQLTSWTDEGHFPDRAVTWYQPEDQAWAVQPPLNTTQLTSWTDPQADPTPPGTYDPTDPAFVGVPIIPAFDPAAGFSWNGDDRQDRSTDPVWYDPSEQAWSVIPPQNAVQLTGWTVEDHFPDQARHEYQPEDQAWAVGPPQNADRLTEWTDPQADPAPPLTYDPSEQSWSVGPPQNAVALTAWTDDHYLPDQSRREYDGQDSAFGIPPITPTPFDPSSFPWPAEPHVPDLTRTEQQPEQQAWAVGPPQNADRLSAFTDPQADTSIQPTWYDGQDGSPSYVPAEATFPWSGDSADQLQSIQPVWADGQDGSIVLTIAAPFNPSGFPWNGALDPQQDVSLQPVWTDGEHGGQPIVPPFDPRFPWNGSLDSQQDRSLQPVWYDGQDGALGLVPPTDQALLGGVWNLDHQQDRSIWPVWYEPEVSNVFTAALNIIVIVTGGRGPDSGSADSLYPSGSVTAPVPSSSASGPTPSGSATSPTPRSK